MHPQVKHKLWNSFESNRKDQECIRFYFVYFRHLHCTILWWSHSLREKNPYQVHARRCKRTSKFIKVTSLSPHQFLFFLFLTNRFSWSLTDLFFTAWSFLSMLYSQLYISVWPSVVLSLTSSSLSEGKMHGVNPE